MKSVLILGISLLVIFSAVSATTFFDGGVLNGWLTRRQILGFQPCKDSDGGLDYFTRGFVSGGTRWRWSGTPPYDTCFTSKVLTEYYCKNGARASQRYKCPQGCRDGTCLGQQGCRNGACLDQNSKVDFLIITRPMFLKSLDKYIEWKTTNGFKVGVLTVDWLSAQAQFDDATIAGEIKNAIHLFRGRGTKFVLLVGDAVVHQPVAETGVPNPPTAHLQMNTLQDPWMVPTGYYYRNLRDESYVTEEYTDVFFADPKDWDPDNNNVNDALDTASSNWQDFAFVGRWPVHTPAEIGPIVAKTIEVGERAAQGKYAKKIVFPYDPSLFSIEGIEIPAVCRTNYINLPFDTLIDSGTAWYWKNRCEIGIVGIRRAFENTAFTLEMQPFTLYDDTTQLEPLIFGESPLKAAAFHGSHASLSAGPLYLSTSNLPDYQFSSSSLWTGVSSCLIGTFAEGDDDALMEAMFKRNPGPAVMGYPTLEYQLYSKIIDGRSVGEAFYASKTVEQRYIDYWKQRQETSPVVNLLGSGNGLTLQNSDALLGDPSLIFYPQ